MELADEFQRGINLSRSSAADESELELPGEQEVLCRYF